MQIGKDLPLFFLCVYAYREHLDLCAPVNGSLFQMSPREKRDGEGEREHQVTLHPCVWNTSSTGLRFKVRLGPFQRLDEGMQQHHRLPISFVCANGCPSLSVRLGEWENDPVCAASSTTDNDQRQKIVQTGSQNAKTINRRKPSL